MQSFKNYLIETSGGHLPGVTVYVDIAETISLPNTEALEFKIDKFIKHTYKLSNFQISIMTNMIIVRMRDIPKSLFDTADFLGDIHDIVTTIFENPDDAYHTVNCQWPPAYKIAHETASLTLITNQTSLKGIEKLIEGDLTYQLYVTLVEPANHVGVLSLLKIHGLRYITLTSKNAAIHEKLNKVNVILNEHLNNGEKDILTCQIELIEHDLEEYAYL